MRRSLVAWALGLGLFGCGGGSARYAVAVDRVVVDRPGAVDEAGLRAALETAVAASDEFSVGHASDALALHASLVDAEGEQPGAPPLLHLELRVPDDLKAQFDVAAIRANAPVDAAVAQAAEVAVHTLALRLQLARGHADAAIALLGASDPETVMLALEWIRDHPASSLADPVAARLEHEDPQVVLLALDVLARVGDARHASAVIRRVERWPGLARDAYRTLGALGGADAVGFLQFAAANEDEAALRVEAERALAGATDRVAVRPHGVDLPRMARGHRQ